MSAWARIYASLKAALPAACYHFDKSLERVTQDAGGVTAHFADGPFDCLVHLKEDRTLTDQAGRGPRLRVSRPDLRPGGSHCAPYAGLAFLDQQPPRAAAVGPVGPSREL